MKTAARENPKCHTSVVASRAHETEGQNKPAPWGGLDGKKNSGDRRTVFFFYGTYRPLGMQLERYPNTPRKSFESHCNHRIDANSTAARQHPRGCKENPLANASACDSGTSFGLGTRLLESAKSFVFCWRTRRERLARGKRLYVDPV